MEKFLNVKMYGGYVDMDIQYENGCKQYITMTLESFRLRKFKNKLIQKKYKLEDIEELLDLHKDAINKDRCYGDL